MSSPFVCEICGADITLGRHGSGWRHVSTSHSDHRVKKISREDYKTKIADNTDAIANSKADNLHNENS